MSLETPAAVSAEPRTRRAGTVHKPASLRKSGAMITAVLLAYVVVMARFTPRLIYLFYDSTSRAEDAALVIFILQLNVFWLFTCFYIGQALFSFWSWIRPAPPPPPLEHEPRVAILYTTFHDFQEGAVLTCLEQDYPHCKTFILDDSKRDDAKEVVDDFARRYPEVTVIRRGDSKGYKAGNINNALTNHIHGYDYFAIADADSRFPADFVRSVLPHFGVDKQIGFVQARFVPPQVSEPGFAEDLHLQIHSMWSVYCRARNRFGSVIFLGHGGMLRYDVWRAIGGFPEIISEDLGFSHRAARLGYRGLYVLDVASVEEFPEGYSPFRKQQTRYVQGVTQYFHREYGAYFRSPHVRWFEKIDTLLTGGSLLMPAFFLSFIVLYAVVMPFLFGVRNVLLLRADGFELTLPVRLLSKQFYDIAFAPDYLVWTIVCTLSPMLGALPLLFRRPWSGLRMLALGAAPYMSLMVAGAASIGSYLLFRTAVFTATGDKSKNKAAQSRGAFFKRFFSPAIMTGLCEFGLGIMLFVACVLTLNPVLPAFAIGICLAPVLLIARWESAWLRPLLYLPLTSLVIGLTCAVITMFMR